MAEDFGLNTLMQALSGQQESAEKRRLLQTQQQERLNAANQQMSEVAKRSAGVSQKLVDDLNPLFETVAKTEQGRQEQERLRGSGNIGDFLSFVGNEVLKPDTHTKKGRQETLAEASNQMSIKTQVANLQQAALSDVGKVIESDLVNSGAELSMAALQETQANERLNAEVASIQSKSNLLLANRQLAENKIAMMSSEEVRIAAAKSNGKPIDVGGVLLSAGDLEARITILNDRELLNEQRALAKDNERFELEKKIAYKTLETMSVAELRPMLLQGSPDHDLSDVQKVYDVKVKAQADESAQILSHYKTTDFGGAVLAPAIETMQRIESSSPKTGPLSAAVKGHKSMLVAVTTNLDAKKQAGLPITAEDIATANLAIESSNNALEASIEKEAKLKAKGDKDMLDIYTELYRGNPVPQASVNSAITKRLGQGRSLDDVMPAPVAKAITKRFNERYQELLSQNQTNFAVDKDSLKEQAMQEATQAGIQEAISDRTNDLFMSPLLIPGNPLAGKIHQNEMAGIIASADARGKDSFMSVYGLTEDEMSLFLAGKPVPGNKVDGAAASNLSAIQSQEFLISLDAREHGLSKKYVDWWNMNGNQYIQDTYNKRLTEAKTSGMQDYAFESYAAKIEAEQTQVYLYDLNSSMGSYDQIRDQRRKELVMFDLNPNHMQAVMLNLDDSLNDQDRKVFMRDFLMPIIEQGKEKNLPFEDINTAVEKAIDANLAPNPEIAKLLKKVAANRQAVQGRMESFTTSWNFSAKPEKNGPSLGFNPGQWVKHSTNRYSWYQDLMKVK